jgi:hypothetical protein
MPATSGDPHFYLLLSAFRQSYERHKIVNFTLQGGKVASKLETRVQILPRYEGFVVVSLPKHPGMHASCVDGLHIVNVHDVWNPA